MLLFFYNKIPIKRSSNSHNILKKISCDTLTSTVIPSVWETLSSIQTLYIISANVQDMLCLDKKFTLPSKQSEPATTRVTMPHKDTYAHVQSYIFINDGA